MGIVFSFMNRVDQVPGFASNESSAYALIITSILSDRSTQSSMSRRLREAIAANRRSSTQKTRSEIRNLIWEHFLGRAPQRRLLTRPDSGFHPVRDTQDGPASKVFDTVELLEAILLQLPALGLITASRTDEMFHTVVNTSPSLQSKLFLRPIEPTATVDFIYEDAGNLRRRYVIAELNPMLRLKYHINDLPNRLPVDVSGDRVVFTNRAVLTGCWTSMYLTNPPRTEASLHFTYAIRRKKAPSTPKGPRVRYRTSYRTIRRDEGVTFALLVEVMRSGTGVTESSGDSHWDYSTHKASAKDIQRWAEQDQGSDERLDFTQTSIDLHGIALLSQENLQQMKHVEAECNMDVDAVIEEGERVKSPKSISRWEMRMKGPS